MPPHTGPAGGLRRLGRVLRCDAMRCDAMQAAEGVVALAAMLSYPVAHEASRLLLLSLHPRDMVLSAVRLVGRTAYPRALFQ